MSKDRLIAVADRCGTLIIAVTSVAAFYLLLACLSEWSEEGCVFLSIFPTTGRLHSALVIASVAAISICLSVLLFAVTVEARRMQQFRESLHLAHRRQNSSRQLRGRPFGYSGPDCEIRPAFNGESDASSGRQQQSASDGATLEDRS